MKGHIDNSNEYHPTFPLSVDKPGPGPLGSSGKKKPKPKPGQPDDHVGRALFHLTLAGIAALFLLLSCLPPVTGFGLQFEKNAEASEPVSVAGQKSSGGGGERIVIWRFKTIPSDNKVPASLILIGWGKICEELSRGAKLEHALFFSMGPVGVVEALVGECVLYTKVA